MNCGGAPFWILYAVCCGAEGCALKRLCLQDDAEADGDAYAYVYLHELLARKSGALNRRLVLNAFSRGSRL
ncbi:hypothetical protein ARMGADRAFT_230313 [Armillaria gallica]|uniref:Uncharacterized protein n=1 Tax=Armillaria gallica TaxID=47427 RepID=A0A2H3E2Z7_ARMGA|nr:hypothetical protein ARMGADRAFT_230313 [Armillaria gallica]